MYGLCSRQEKWRNKSERLFCQGAFVVFNGWDYRIRKQDGTGMGLLGGAEPNDDFA